MFTVENMETAMSLWEAYLEEVRKPVVAPAYNRFTEEHGTSQARLIVMGWVQECESEWSAAVGAGTQQEPYDWEHCPAFFNRKLSELYPDT